jgi:hypothetical protein
MPKVEGIIIVPFCKAGRLGVLHLLKGYKINPSCVSCSSISGNTQKVVLWKTFVLYI